MNDQGIVRTPDRQQQAVEVAVFLFLVVPSMALSFAAGTPDSLSFTTVALANIVRDLALMSLVLYFVWSNREGLAAIGLRNGHLAREVMVGVALFVPFYLLIVVLQATLGALGLPGPEAPPPFLIPSGTWELALALLFVTVVAVSEEIIFRGYLIRRFAAVTGTTGVAIFLAAFVFALGHGYQGSGGVIAVGILGLVFGWMYLWRGSLVAPMTVHFIQDFIGIVIAPLYL